MLSVQNRQPGFSVRIESPRRDAYQPISGGKPPVLDINIEQFTDRWLVQRFLVILLCLLFTSSKSSGQRLAYGPNPGCHRCDGATAAACFTVSSWPNRQAAEACLSAVNSRSRKLTSVFPPNARSSDFAACALNSSWNGNLGLGALRYHKRTFRRGSGAPIEGILRFRPTGSHLFGHQSAASGMLNEHVRCHAHTFND